MPQFTNVLNLVADENLRIKPILHSYFIGGKFPDRWTVAFEKQQQRKPDGWFHPSTHPLMTDRQLYYYLTEPDRWAAEEFGYDSWMSVLMGTAMHDFVEMALTDLGVLQRPEGACPACGRAQPSECSEWGFVHEATRTRGHMDGRIDATTGFEFKTTRGMNLRNFHDGDIGYIREHHAVYYAQAQEYMRISGLREQVLLFMGFGYPWDMREVTIPYDEVFAYAMERKYTAVLRAADRREPPDQCCNIGSPQSKICPALTCPVRNR